MLKKTERISAALLKNVRPEHTIREKFIVVKLFKGPEPLGRCSVVVSKSVAKYATTRNALRRSIYEWARTNHAAIASYNVLFLPMSPIVNCSNQEIKEILTNIFKNFK